LFFQTDDNDKIKVSKISYNVIVITTPKNVTKLMSQVFFHFGPLPIRGVTRNLLRGRGLEMKIFCVAILMT